MNGRPIAEVLEAARARLDRVPSERLRAEHDAGAFVVDIRSASQREEYGVLDFAVHVERNVLEWRLDPTSEAALPNAAYDLRVILVCQQGYQSSLAAAGLRDLGVAQATDLVGGFEAWMEQ